MWYIYTRCAFNLDRRRKQYLPISNRLDQQIKDLQDEKGGDGLLLLHRGTEEKIYLVRMLEVRTKTGVETRITEGWSEFVRLNSLEIGDYIEIEMEDWQKWLFRVRIWRNEQEITIVDPHVIIENDGTRSDADSTKFIPMEVLGDGFLEFKATFTRHNIKCGRMNVPVAFARANFIHLDETTPVEVRTNRVWKATMHITFHKSGKINSCIIMDGIDKLIKAEGIQPRETVFVLLQCNKTPELSVMFT